MDTLLNLPAISSHHDLKGLRYLYDSVEAQVHGALGITANTYGGLQTSILMKKLPSQIQLIALTEEKWEVEKPMKIVNWEVNARERSATSHTSNPTSAPKRQLPRTPLTATALMISNSGPFHCAFCEQDHISSSCTFVMSMRVSTT